MRRCVHHFPPIAALAAVVALLTSAAPARALFTISGTVRDQLAQPVPNVDILLYDDNGNPIGIPPTLTNGAGFYSIAGLPNGRYELGFEPPTVTKLLPMNVQNIDVNNANVTVDATLDPGLLVSGFVRDTTGAPIADIDLNISQGGGNLLNTPGDNTDPTGFYDVIVPAGTWDIEWRAVAPGALPWIRVTMLDVAIASDVQIDVTMVIGVHMSGIVRSNGVPVVNANLDFIDVSTGIKIDTPGDVTDLTGAYNVHVPIDTYDIRVKPDPGQRLVAVEQTGVGISTDTVRDFALQPGLSLAGFARRTNGTGVGGLDVDVAVPATGAKLFTPGDITDPTGHYEVFVPAGTYTVTFEPPVATLLVPQRLQNVAIAADTQLSVTLADGVLLTGLVRRTSGVGVASVDIDAKRTSTGLDVPLVGDLTDGNGNFAVVVAPDVYDLEIEPPVASSLVAQRLASTSVFGTLNVTVTLQSGWQVTGATTDQVSELVRNADVDVFDPGTGALLFTPTDKTDAFGHYAIVVPAGTWRFVFTPDPAVIVAPPRTIDNFLVNRNRVLNVVFASTLVTDAGDPAVAAPARPLRLLPVWPTPFNPSTQVEFEVTRPGPVRLVVFDARGRRVRTLFDGHADAGSYRLHWDGADTAGTRLPSGTYLVRAEGGGESVSRKLTLVR